MFADTSVKVCHQRCNVLGSNEERVVEVAGVQETPCSYGDGLQRVAVEREFKAEFVVGLSFVGATVNGDGVVLMGFNVVYYGVVINGDI